MLKFQKFKKVARKSSKIHKNSQNIEQIENHFKFVMSWKNRLKTFTNSKKIQKHRKRECEGGAWKKVAWERWMAPGTGKKFPKYRGWVQNGRVPWTLGGTWCATLKTYPGGCIIWHGLNPIAYIGVFGNFLFASF